jgi:hypothetical protein
MSSITSVSTVFSKSMDDCGSCNRRFKNAEALQQHKRDSPKHTSRVQQPGQQQRRDPTAHVGTFRCEACKRPFASADALRQHRSILHGNETEVLQRQDGGSSSLPTNIACKMCNCQFGSASALQQHQRDSPNHTTEASRPVAQPTVHSIDTTECKLCDRRFNSTEALQQHRRDSPSHTVEALQQDARPPADLRETTECKLCNRTFNSIEARRQHQQNSPAHQAKASKQAARPPTNDTRATDCRLCNRRFDSTEALGQHKRYSATHVARFLQQRVEKTPFHTIDTEGEPSTRIPVGSSRPNQHPPDTLTELVIVHCERCSRSFRSEVALQAHEDSSHANSPWSVHPALHDEVSQLLEVDGLLVDFYEAGGWDDCIKDYDTNVMGAFACNKPACPVQKWTSKKIAISIRLYKNKRYDAIVWHQRCQECNSIGMLDLHTESYVERIVYRLKKWFGLAVEEPVYRRGSRAPHREELCEGCKNGHCAAMSN